jgi:hypothetical protein
MEVRRLEEVVGVSLVAGVPATKVVSVFELLPVGVLGLNSSLLQAANRSVAQKSTAIPRNVLLESFIMIFLLLFGFSILLFKRFSLPRAEKHYQRSIVVAAYPRLQGLFRVPQNCAGLYRATYSSVGFPHKRNKRR